LSSKRMVDYEVLFIYYYKITDILPAIWLAVACKKFSMASCKHVFYKRNIKLVHCAVASCFSCSDKSLCALWLHTACGCIFYFFNNSAHTYHI
jgi:hypothetical protein